MANVSLLGSTSRVSTPYIKVTIGSYTFGVYQRQQATVKNDSGFYQAAKIIYPNYIKSLNIVKINGQVNTYTLNIAYPIDEKSDPNFFEKVFSSVSQSRKIVFSYGDMALPTYIYKDEEAIITKVKSSFDIKQSIINYTVTAISSATLLVSGTYTFNNSKPKKPSDEIKKLLNGNYGLQEIFYGMLNQQLVESKGLIPGDDKVVQIESKTNISALEYLNYLVSCMIPAAYSVSTNNKNKIFYALKIIDDTSGEFGGPYFKIERITKNVERTDAYEIDIGYQTANIVTSFSIDDDETYSIYYDWQNKLNDQSYVYRLDDDGKWTPEYAPIISSRNNEYNTRVSDSTWWTKLTEYPINATITLKGLLRPAILMSYVRLRVYFFGVEHISSGLYIVTKQTDNISERGYYTTLNLTRISGAD